MFGCADQFVGIIKQFHEATKGRVVVGNLESDLLEVNHGIKQGCVLTPNTVHPISNNRHVFRRETVQPCKTEGQDQDQEGVDNRTVFADDTALIAHNQAQM